MCRLGQIFAFATLVVLGCAAPRSFGPPATDGRVRHEKRASPTSEVVLTSYDSADASTSGDAERSVGPGESATPMGWKLEQAREHEARGARLARRGAYFSARIAFLAAVENAIEARDVQEMSNRRTASLRACLSALARAEEAAGEEGDDSSPNQPSLGGATFRMVAQRQSLVQQQLASAQQQLVEAARGIKEVGEPLRGLARIHELLARQGAIRAEVAQQKAVVFYRGALAALPENAHVANDLGVALARCGEFRAARVALEQSSRLEVRPVVLRNLSLVYQQLGETEQAQAALGQLQSVPANRSEEVPQPGVRWVDPDTMARMAAEGGAWSVGVWDAYAYGEYVARPRLAHVPEYRLRPDDQLDMVFRQTRQVTGKPYRLSPGDEIRVQSLSRPADINFDRVLIEPDGMITLRLLGQVPAAGQTVVSLTQSLEERYKTFFPNPTIVVSPLKVNTRLQDLLEAVDRRYGAGGGQGRSAIVTPDGTIALPEINTLPVQGLTIPELEVELNERFREKIEGVSISPALVKRASRYVYVLGEVRAPGRYELLAPTTLSQALSLGGSYLISADLKHIVVLRRDDQWQLMGCVFCMSDLLCRKKPCPRQDIWICDSDVVYIPKSELWKTNELIEMVFTRGIYSVFPFSVSYVFTSPSAL